MNPGMIGGGAACALVCLACYVWGYRRSSLRYDIISEVPTIAAKDIPGLGAAMVEVKGMVRAERPLVSDLARVHCVAFESRVTEHWTTTHMEHDKDGRTRTVTEHHSETRYENEVRIAFRVDDESGSVVVHPEGASLDLLDGMELAGIDEPMPNSPAYGISPRHGGSLSYSENVYPVGIKTYVLGQVSENNEIVAPTVVKRPFVISHRTEETLLSGAKLAKRIWGMLVILLLIAVMGLLAVGFGLVYVGHGPSPWQERPAYHRVHQR